jgi:MFS transporter, DHA2 family, multidrug resistance protein
LGLAASAFQTRATAFDEMLVPQIIRGSAIMFCLLPPIRLALGHLAPEAVPNASGLFNVLRNLGGAIGLALIDTVLYGRTPEIAQRFGEALARGDAATAQRIGLPLERFLAHVPGTPVDPQVLAYVEAAVRRQAMVEAVNEAWLMLALLSLVGALALLCPRPAKPQA